MILSAIWDSKRFVLKDGWPLHMVKLVGAVRNFCVNIGPKGRPNNLQSAWRLVKLFFWSDLSWSQADLYADSYVISTHFSLLSTMSLCTHYISYIGILRIIHNALFRISIIFNNMAIRPYRFSSYLWLFVFFNFWITCTYRLILCFDISSHCVFLMKFVECWLYEHLLKELIKSELVVFAWWAFLVHKHNQLDILACSSSP